jgi:hypothetical protein
LAEADRIDLTSFDLSKLSAEALDEILAGASFSIASEDDLLKQLLSLGNEYGPLLSRIAIRFLSPVGRAILAEHSAFPPDCLFCSTLDHLLHLLPPSGWNSAIVPDFPKLFEDFKKKQFTLLWRGSRDGFSARDFHSRCDGHPNTLTVILDTKGNIFGGFTPVEWDSAPFSSKHKADPSLKSFIFTLKNPHNVPARRFALKSEKKEEAIVCDSQSGPNFWDIFVSDNCDQAIFCGSKWFPIFCDICASDNRNANIDSFTLNFGTTYTNDTGLDGNTFFTGSQSFRVEEIEIFEITK